MRGKDNQVKNHDKQYALNRPFNEPIPKKRLDLNDLLRRAQDKKKSDKKYNFLIFSGAVFVVVLFYLLVSIQ